MPALITITMIWDSNITKVKPADPSGVGVAFTTSGETNPLSVGRAYTATVTLNTGYILDTVTSNNTNIVISDITENTFIFTHTDHTSTSATINITSKSNISKVSIDLTTLTGWDNVSSGEHTIQVIAKATGYRDSTKSTAVSFTKASVPTGETWLLNETINLSTQTFTTNFVSNGQNFNSLKLTNTLLEYDTTTVYAKFVPEGGSNWVKGEAYRTIILSESATGDLLTWLQANGTKQGGGTTAHTLTIEEQYSYATAITVNGNAVTSPYTLQNGDVIKVPTLTKTTINGTSYSTFDESTLIISGEDITVSRSGAEKTTEPVPYITINYTENANSGGNIQ